jgi:hypothetical protein
MTTDFELGLPIRWRQFCLSFVIAADSSPGSAQSTDLES